MTAEIWRRRLSQLRSLPRAMVEEQRDVRSLVERVTALEEDLDRISGALAGAVMPARVYLGAERAWVRTPWGGKLLVDTTDLLIAPYLLLDGIWEPDVTQFFQRTLKPGMTFVDVGANLGYFTILAALTVGWTGKVVAFEAQPDTYELLAKNAIVNWVNSFVTVENKAVYSRSCNLDFFVRKRYPGNSSIGLAGDEHLEQYFDTSERIEVPAVSLDEYFAGRSDKLDVIKVDVEGGEVQAFKGMEHLLDDNPQAIIMCEWSRQQIRDAKDDPAELIELWKRHRLETFRIDPALTPLTSEELLATEYCNVGLRRRS